jgi:hypothetical protein
MVSIVVTHELLNMMKPISKYLFLLLDKKLIYKLGLHDF